MYNKQVPSANFIFDFEQKKIGTTIVRFRLKFYGTTMTKIDDANEQSPGPYDQMRDRNLKKDVVYTVVMIST